ncbi:MULTISPECIES: TolC family protein [Streptomyces]|nr:TolC family protein [Streptomyces sp. TSRI0384-2]
MAELLARLRRASVNGVVPELAFARNVRGLGLGQAEQSRLRDELARLGLPVQDLRVRVGAGSPDAEKVAPSREERVSPRTERARVLLARYEDADGFVVSRALDGVIRLTGLTAREAGELRAVARVRRVADPEAEPKGSGGAAAGTTAAEGAEAVGGAGDVAERQEADIQVPSPAVKAPAVKAPAVKAPGAKPEAREADWEQARLMSARFRGGIDWLAEYALLALGTEGLAAVLGPAAAVDVVHAVRGIRTPGQHVLAALEALQRVFDSLKRAGLRPEDFFERPAAALDGLTPHAFLVGKPLVYSASRLAVRDALRELSAGTSKGGSAAAQDVRDVAEDGSLVAEGAESAVTEATPEAVAVPEAEHCETEAETIGAGGNHERPSRPALKAPEIAVEAEAEQPLEGFHQRERHLRAEAEERIALLEREHDEARQELVRRAEQAEEAARIAAEQVVLHQNRAEETDRRLREYRDGAEERIAQLEARLRQTQDLLAQRDHALHTAREQSEAVQGAAADTRTTLWSRWRRT